MAALGRAKAGRPRAGPGHLWQFCLGVLLDPFLKFGAPILGLVVGHGMLLFDGTASDALASFTTPIMRGDLFTHGLSAGCLLFPGVGVAVMVYPPFSRIRGPTTFSFSYVG